MTGKEKFVKAKSLIASGMSTKDATKKVKMSLGNYYRIDGINKRASATAKKPTTAPKSTRTNPTIVLDQDAQGLTITGSMKEIVAFLSTIA